MWHIFILSWYAIYLQQVFVRKIKTLSPPLSFLPPGIYSGRKRVILLLLASKAKVNMQSAKGSTALMWAARRGDDDVVTELLGKKKDFKLSPLYHHICFCFKRSLIEAR